MWILWITPTPVVLTSTNDRRAHSTDRSTDHFYPQLSPGLGTTPRPPLIVPAPERGVPISPARRYSPRGQRPQSVQRNKLHTVRRNELPVEIVTMRDCAAVGVAGPDPGPTSAIRSPWVGWSPGCRWTAAGRAG